MANAKTKRIDGDAGNNVLVGSPLDDNIIYGGAGNDLIKGGSKRDVLVGEAGNDTISGGDDVDGLWGGGGQDSLSGGAGNDRLVGDGGNDTLDGGTGADTLEGGTGNDIYVLDDLGDRIIETADGGIDWVYSSVSVALSSNLENVQVTGAANASITGNELDNFLNGNSGANVIDGGAGIDTMAGGAGNDTYILDQAADQIVEAAGSGIDTVRAGFSFATGRNIENLVLTGTGDFSGSGNDLDNTLTGNNANNLLSGGNGNDILAGSGGNDTLDGGAGTDRLLGGTGDDTYVIDQSGDQAIEAAGEGADRVTASVSFVLGSNIESLVLTGAGDINGTGNDLDNAITGNGGRNLLSGGSGNDVLTGNDGDDTLDGGTGADTLNGGAGNDTYYVDNAGDRIVEAAGGGTDTVYSSNVLTLFSNVENGQLIGSTGVSITGNTMANVLNGNAGANVIDGGAGIDTMAGGAGNDTYILDQASDQVIETTGGGIDTVQAGFSVVLGANIENLVLTGIGNFSGDGNELDNSMTGNGGNNVIYGRDGNDGLLGASGNDTLWGGEGRDTVTGGEGNDSVNGGAREDTVGGGLGNDTLFGGGENDVLNGGDGSDRVVGDGGNDVIQGGAGNDIMTGGQMDGSVPKGANTFLWERADVVTAQGLSAGFDKITDFGAGDRLDISAIFNGTHPANLTNYVHVTDSTAGTTISVNVGGGVYMDLVQLLGVHESSLSSFLSHYSIIA